MFGQSGKEIRPNEIDGDDEKQSVNSARCSTGVQSHLQENAVVGGLSAEQNLPILTDEIKEGLKISQQSVFVDESIFGAKQLATNSTFTTERERQCARTGIEARNVAASLDIPATNNVAETSKLAFEYEEIAVENRELEENSSSVRLTEVKKNKTMSTFLKPVRDRKKEKNGKTSRKPGRKTGEEDRATVQLKIDLKVADNSSPDNGSSELRNFQLSAQGSENDVAVGDRKLRLDGVGEGEATDERKSLLQPTKSTEETSKSKVSPSNYALFYDLVYSVT